MRRDVRPGLGGDPCDRLPMIKDPPHSARRVLDVRSAHDDPRWYGPSSLSSSTSRYRTGKLFPTFMKSMLAEYAVAMTVCPHSLPLPSSARIPLIDGETRKRRNSE